MYFNLLWNEFAALPEVEAIALGGSRAGADYDEKSDYDLYIYCNSIPYESMRKCILERCCQYMEIGNSFWELESLQKKYRIPYPDELRNNIINKNLRLLTGNLPSYDAQIKKAFARGDMVSVNHRTAAFLESYFDIIFALNKLTHPGEKRMVSYAKAQAEILPADFEKNLDKLFENIFTDSDKTLQTLREMITELENAIKCRDMN